MKPKDKSLRYPFLTAYVKLEDLGRRGMLVELHDRVAQQVRQLGGSTLFTEVLPTAQNGMTQIQYMTGSPIPQATLEDQLVAEKLNKGVAEEPIEGVRQVLFVLTSQMENAA